MTKLKEIFRIIFRKNEEDVKVKTKMTLRKKLALGGLGVVGLIGGIFTLSKYGNAESEDGDFFEDENYEYETDETEDLDDTDVSEDDVEVEAEV